jgi:hypothetical protein
MGGRIVRMELGFAIDVEIMAKMIDEGELPDVPNMDMGRAQHILVRFSEVKDKIQTILDGEPLKVDVDPVKSSNG